MLTYDVAPCPFCGGTKAITDTANRFPHMGDDPGPDGWASALQCVSCAATGPWAKGDTPEQARSSALRRWARRVEVTP